MTDTYDDIINLPHHVSETRPHMPLIDRAAQFAPFAAVVGYDAAVRETARLTERRIELDEYEKESLNDRLLLVADWLGDCPMLAITYFVPDAKKAGGAYRTISGRVKKIDEYECVIMMMDGTCIPIEEIIAIEGEQFNLF